MMRDSYSHQQTPLVRTSGQGTPSSWFFKLLVLIILLLCAAIGMVGLILPVIPGFLFLALAVFCAARLSPALAAKLERYSWFRSYMRHFDRFSGLTWRGKAQLAFWLLLKLLWDSLVWLVEALAWVLHFALATPERREPGSPSP